MVKLSDYVRDYYKRHVDGVECYIEKADILIFVYKLCELCDDYHYSRNDLPIVERFGCFLIRKHNGLDPSCSDCSDKVIYDYD